MNYNKVNNYFGWLCAVIATLTYVLTAERTTSWWDTGEFIASAYKMQIVHQPGAPLFLMIQNIFGNLAMGDKTQLALWMNIGSAVCSGLTILFLFWTITALARKIFAGYSSEKDLNNTQMWTIIGAGLVGALAYTYTDTFWFSAVESEVYAMSSLCTAVVFWGVLKWEVRADKPGSAKWLLLVAYVMGLSIGVHLLNLLMIPAIALIIYFRKNEVTTAKGVFKALGIGVIVLGFVLWGLIQYPVKIAANMDLLFVNKLGMPFGTGVLVFAVILIALLVFTIYYSIKKAKPMLHMVMLGLTLILFGYSSFSMIVIRAKADPTLNNSDPDNAFSFLSYLNREQYASSPLIKGPFFDSKILDEQEGGNMYRKDKEKYEVARKKVDYTYDRTTLFPRIHSNREEHVLRYRQYLNLGPDERPTMMDNLKFFFNYQLGHMYGRYFMWNFVGRQNQAQGHGSLTEGNWISGIKPIDALFLGSQDKLPESEKNNPERNTYYFLPLILGLVGLVWHSRKSKKDASVVGLLFFFTGAAVVLYLNDTPFQPRERDYVYVGSFYAFSIWIGLSVLAMWEWFSKKINTRSAAVAATILGLAAAPAILAKQNWRNHDRSEKYLARDMARNYLDSCAPNAILFTFADNDTYPIWYLQEVEGFRTDVRVVNLSLLGSAWYMQQMMKKVNEADALPMNIDPEKIKEGVRDVIYYVDHNIDQYVDVESLLAIMLSDNPQNMLQMQNGKYINVLPTKNMRFEVDREAVIANNVVPENWKEKIVDSMEWEYPNNIVTRADLSLLAVLVHNNWERPIYFTGSGLESSHVGLDRYLVSEGFAWRLMPVETDQPMYEQEKLVNADTAYRNIMEKYKWGNIREASYIDPDSYKLFGSIVGEVFGQTAKSLWLEDKIDEARDLVNKAYDVMPERTYTMYEAMNYPILVDTAYKVGETKIGREMAERNLAFVSQNLDYYFDVTGGKPEWELGNIRMALNTIIMFKSIADRVNDPELNRTLAPLVEKYKVYWEES